MSHWMLLVNHDENKGQAIEVKPYLSPEGEFPTFGKGMSTSVPSFNIQLYPRNRKNDNPALRRSADIGGSLAYQLLWDEEAIKNEKGEFDPYAATSNFALEPIPTNVHGRSADLLFALAVVTAALPLSGGGTYPHFAATGKLDEPAGSVYPVEGVPAKLRAAFDVLKKLSGRKLIFYPIGNENDVDRKTKRRARRYGIELCSVRWLDEAIEKLGVPLDLYSGSPYMGLESFTRKHHAVYFGREKEATDLVEELVQLKNKTTAPALIILAASGAGKSSFIQAGLLPKLEKHAQLADRPILFHLWTPSKIRTAIGITTSIDVPMLLQILREHWLPENIAEMLSETEKQTIQQANSFTELAYVLVTVLPNDRRFLWAMDQAEELFTLPFTDDEVIRGFAQFMSQLRDLGVWIIVALRNDFFPAYQQYLTKVFNHEHKLQHLTSEALDSIIQSPANRARRPPIKFGTDEKGISLATLLREDMKHETDALPLLEFALTELYKKSVVRSKETALENNDESFTLNEIQNEEHGSELKRPPIQKCLMMTWDDYRDIGFLHGAIGNRAEEIFQDLDIEEQAALPQLLWDLTIARNDPKQRLAAIAIITSQVVELTKYSENSPMRRLISAFANARLLILSNDDNRVVTVRVVHEALLNHWKKAAEEIAEFADKKRLHERLQNQAMLWKEGKAGLLPAGFALKEAETLLAWRRDWLDSSLIEFIKASRKSKRKRTATVVILSLLTVGTGLGIWDGYYREHVEYYANYVKRWGLPEGIGAVSAEQAQHRLTTYQLVRRGRNGLVLGIRIINRHGNCSSLFQEKNGFLGNTDGSVGISNRECIYRFERNSDTGKVIKEIAYDRNKRGRYVLQYTSDTTAQYTDPQGYPNVQTKSGAAYVRFQRTAEGFDQEISYTDRNGIPKANFDGCFIRRYSLDKNGQVITSLCLNQQSEPMPELSGDVLTKKRYDANGNSIEYAFFDGQGQPIKLKDGFAKVTTQYDEFGNPIEEAYFDEQGNPFLKRDGCSKITIRYKERGNLIEITCFDEQGQPTLISGGFFKAIARLDENNNIIEQIFFDKQGQPIRLKDGFAKWTAHYDKKNNQTEIAFFDERGQPIRHKDGYAKWTAIYDERGNVISTVFFDEKGQPTRNKYGYAQQTKHYDESDNVIEEAYFDERSQPIRIKNGYAKWTARYDKHRNMIEGAYFNEQGQPTRDENGYVKWIAYYDDLDNKTEVAYYDEKNRLIRNKDSVAKWTAIYDERGNTIEEAYFDEQGLPTRREDGCAKRTREYDERGNVIEAVCLDEQGHLTRNNVDNCAKLVQHYDERNNVIEVACFDEQTHLTRNKAGSAKQTKGYDTQGNVIEEANFDEQAQPTRNKMGYAKQIRHYDNRGNPVEAAYFDEQGQPTRINNCAKQTSLYDVHGNMIELVCFDEQGQPTLNKEGYAKFTARYDERGNQIESSTFDEKGRLVKQTGEIAARNLIAYNAQNQIIQRCLFDENNRLLEMSKIINKIVPERQADKLGIQVGDVLESYNGEMLRSGEHFIKLVDQLGTDNRELVLLRKGKSLHFSVAPSKIGIGFQWIPTNENCLIEEKTTNPSVTNDKKVQTKRVVSPDELQPKFDYIQSLIKTATELEAKADLDGALKNWQEILAVLESLPATAAVGASELQIRVSLVYQAMGNVLSKQNDWTSATDAYRTAADKLEDLLRRSPKNSVEYKKNLVSVLGNISFKALFAKRYEQSLAAAHRALELEPKELWIKTNLAHALLFLNRFNEARAVYLENPEQVVFVNGGTFRQAVLQDFKDFRQHGLEHPDMTKIEKLLTLLGTTENTEKPDKK